MGSDGNLQNRSYINNNIENMIANKLTYGEIETIIKPMIKLESFETIFDIVNKVFHIPTEEKSEYIGVTSTYAGFKLKIWKFNYLDYDDKLHPRIILQFKKEKSFIDYFINPMNKILKELSNICASEIHEIRLNKWRMNGLSNDNLILNLIYQKDTFNPIISDYERQHKFSPLTITAGEEVNKYIIEFFFTPECYERKLNKTILRENWSEIFKKSAPFWL